MPEFAYNAARMNGKTVSGKMTAADQGELRKKLEADEKLFLINCNEVEPKQKNQ